MIGLVVSITLAALCCALVVRMENQRHALADARSRLAEVHAEWAASLGREESARTGAEAAVQRERELDALLTETRSLLVETLEREAELRTLLARRTVPPRNVAEA